MKEVIFAGFGGQGVLTGGLVMAEMASQKGLNTVWMPAYGPSMRGGKSNCVVKYGDSPEERVGSPVMEYADLLVAMNAPALDYLTYCKEDAIVFANAHTVPEDQEYPEKVTVVRVDCDKLAEDIKNPKGQCLVMVGAVIAYTKWFEKEYARTCMDQYFSKKGKKKFADLNLAAFDAGYQFVEERL